MKRTRQQRTDEAERDFLTAWSIANGRGWDLVKHSPYHYTLRDGDGGILNLWPSSLKCARDQKRRMSEKFSIAGEWTILDVVKQIPQTELPPTTEPVRGPKLRCSEDCERHDVSMNLPRMAARDWVPLVLCFVFGFTVALTLFGCLR